MLLVTFDTSSIFPRVIRPKMYKNRSKIVRLFRQKFANKLRRECNTKLTKRKRYVQRKINDFHGVCSARVRTQKILYKGAPS